MKVLLVEDDDGIAGPLEAGLVHHGYQVVRVSEGRQVDTAIHGDAPADIVLLDLGLPDMDGLDVCRSIRASKPRLPIIVISARGSEIDRVVGLELGADDYLAKPFGMRELVARIRAVMRRVELPVPGSRDGLQDAPSSDLPTGDASGVAVGSMAESRIKTVGGLTIDHRTHRVLLDGIEIALTAKEYGVLSMLCDDPGAVVTRVDLIEQVWDEHWYGPTKTLDVHVAQLRRKLGNPQWIENVRSVGYRLLEPAQWT